MEAVRLLVPLPLPLTLSCLPPPPTAPRAPFSHANAGSGRRDVVTDARRKLFRSRDGGKRCCGREAKGFEECAVAGFGAHAGFGDGGHTARRGSSRHSDAPFKARALRRKEAMQLRPTDCSAAGGADALRPAMLLLARGGMGGDTGGRPESLPTCVGLGSEGAPRIAAGAHAKHARGANVLTSYTTDGISRKASSGRPKLE
eukprot:352803-Chlamydomonas_euryale.AAC.6